MRRSVREICLQIEPTKPPTGMKWRLSIFEASLKLRLLMQARSGTSEADFRTAAIKKACRQYRAVWWFLLPEAEFAAAASRRQIANMPRQINKAPPPEGQTIHEQVLPACEGCLWP